MRRLLAAVVVAVAASGCATAASTIAEKDRGVAREYDAAEAEAWDLAEAVLRWRGAATFDRLQEQACVVTVFPGDANAPRTYAAVWVEPCAGGVRVTCVTNGTTIPGGLTFHTATAFHDDFAEALAMRRRGERVPTVR